MVQLLCPEGKRTMNANEPIHKRLKSSSLPTPNEPSLDSNESADPHSQYDPLNEPGLLGLNLRKSESLLELCQARVNQAHIDRMEKDAKARVGFSGAVDNLKASNFPAVLLRIGEWEYVSKYEGDLVAKCYFAKHKLVWEVLDGGLKNKIEIEWEAIIGLKAHCPDNGPGTLTIVLGKQPLFFRETNPQPRKHTVWQATTDFTNGEASNYRQHYLQCAPGVLNKHYQKLINCDTRLNLLSQQADASSDAQPAAKDPVKDPNMSNNNGSNQLENAGTHGYVESWGLVRSKAIRLVNAPWPLRTMSISDIVNHTAHCVSEQNQNPARVNEVNHDQLVKNISEILLNNNTQLTTPSDEKSPMSGVNSLCSLIQDGNASNDYSDPDAGNHNGQEWADGNDRFTPPGNLTPENDKGMSRDDSFTDLVDQLPQIETLPRLFFDTSQDGDIVDF
ncbi:hypothetical protein Hdeb2414_s0745g00942121 [Helianthus debilis subsp. tardiflorus]